VAAQLADPTSFFHTIRKMVAVRKGHPAFVSGGLTWAETVSQSVAAYWRSYNGESLLIFNNLSGLSQPVVVRMPDGYSGQPLDLLSGSYSGDVDNGKLCMRLAPYQFVWLKIE